MNLHERVLSVLSCRYTDEVIIGAPWVITEDLLTSMNISVVVHGSVDESQLSYKGKFTANMEMDINNYVALTTNICCV